MSDWTSYDRIAESYEKINGPIFLRLALDLAKMAKSCIRAGSRVLDIGTGTGIAAQTIRSIIPSARVLGVDLSRGMLETACRLHPDLLLSTADVRNLPFPRASFDLISANCVLSHLKNPEAGLTEILRVLKPEGFLVASGWGCVEEDAQRMWYELAGEVVGVAVVQAAGAKGVPSQESFSKPKIFRETLRESGFSRVQIKVRRYEFETALEDYVHGRELTFVGRLMEETLPEKQWRAFREKTRQAIRERFGDPLSYVKEVLLAVARR